MTSSLQGTRFQGFGSLYCGEMAAMTEVAHGVARIDEHPPGEALVTFQSDDGTLPLKSLVQKDMVVLRSLGCLVTFGGLISLNDGIDSEVSSNSISAIHFETEQDAYYFEHLLHSYSTGLALYNDGVSSTLSTPSSMHAEYDASRDSASVNNTGTPPNVRRFSSSSRAKPVSKNEFIPILDPNQELLTVFEEASIKSCSSSDDESAASNESHWQVAPSASVMISAFTRRTSCK